MQSKQDLILEYYIICLHIGQKDSIFQIGRSWLTPFACPYVLFWKLLQNILRGNYTGKIAKKFPIISILFEH